VPSNSISSSLTILDPKPDDSGIFTVLLENLGGSTKSSTNLSVIEESAVKDYVVSSTTSTRKMTKEMEVAEGDTIRFRIVRLWTKCSLHLFCQSFL
jgi:hypothetical protein